MAFVNHRQELENEWTKFGAAASRIVTNAWLRGWKVSVDSTPVRTGLLRSGFRLSTTRRSSYVPQFNSSRGQVRGYPTRPDFRFRITKDRNIYFYNNVPYASFVEYGQGPGIRVPRMMHRKGIETANRLVQIGFKNI